MVSKDTPTSAATSSPPDSRQPRDTSDHAFQLLLLRLNQERRETIRTLNRFCNIPLNMTKIFLQAAIPSDTLTYDDYVFLDSTLYDDECVEEFLRSNPKLYEDLRAVVHVRVPDSKTNLCFCGYFSSSTDDLESHIAANLTSRTTVELLLDRLPTTNMCDDCQQTVRRVTQGDFTDTLLDGEFSLLDWC